MKRNTFLRRLFLSCLSAFLLTSVSVYGQCPLNGTDNFNNASLWVPYGTLASGGGSLTVTGGEMRFTNFVGQQTYRLVKSLGCTSVAGDDWRAEFEFQMNNNSTGKPNYAALPFAMTETTDHCHRANQTGIVPWSDNSSIWVQAADHLSTSIDQVNLSVGSRFSTDAASYSDLIPISRNVKYYVRLERLDDDEVSLSVYSDSLFQTHIQGSPICETIDDRITDLKYIQAGTVTTASTSRAGNAVIDNMNLFDSPVGDFCTAVCDVSASMDWFKDECFYTFTNTSTLGPKNNFMGSFINFGDDTYNQISLNGSVDHSYDNEQNYEPCITTFSWIFDGERYVCCKDEQCYDKRFEKCEEEDGSIDIAQDIECDIYAQFTATNGCNGNVTFNNLSSMSSGFHLTTVIDFGDGSDPIEVGINQNFSHQYSANGTYTVWMTIFGASLVGGKFDCCEERKEVIVTISNAGQSCGGGGTQLPFRKRSLENRDQFASEFSIMPNPAKNEVNLVLEKGLSNIRITSIEGKLMTELLVNDQISKKIDISQYPSGIYLVVVENQGRIKHKKMIKQ